MSKVKDLFKLYCSFFRIGLLTFGGGYAMLSMLQKECIEKNKWVTEEEMLNYFAIGQCTPGVIAVNTSTFVGYKNFGVIGGIVATLGIVSPSFIIITALASIIRLYQNNPYFIKAFAGVRVSVCALIFNSVFKIAKSAIKNWLTCLFAVASFCLLLFAKLSSVYVIIITIVIALIFNWTGVYKNKIE